MTTSSIDKKDKEQATVVLVLGDGDFSYSVDLARHVIQKASPPTSNTTIVEAEPKQSLHLIATGIDSYQALIAKYKNANFLLNHLRGLNASPLATNASGASGTANPALQISLHHNINAVATTASTSTDNDNIPPAHHVLFHHPHLGTEHAQRHARFLCHLFHSVTRKWLAPDTSTSTSSNYFHLTLVQGQFERWKCLEAANRHDMVLVDARPFRAPRVATPYYQHRRHQTGKSFASRTQGSITYTFCRKTTTTITTTNTALIRILVDLLDLQDTTVVAGDSTEAITETIPEPNNVFRCPHCPKSFREERSLKCHVQALHDSKKRKWDGKEEQDTTSSTTAKNTYSCPHCPNADNNGPRMFQSLQALQDHNQAKHFGKHDTIKPDWWCHPATAVATDATIAESQAQQQLLHCAICGMSFSNAKQQQEHEAEFLPCGNNVGSSAENVQASATMFPCCHCNKAFREERAQKQHENFCSFPSASASASASTRQQQQQQQCGVKTTC